MKSIKVRLIGRDSLVLHNGQLANPLSVPSRRISEISKKRNKTEADILTLARLEWEGGLYLEDGQVTIPKAMLYKTFLTGARKTKNGKIFESGAFVLDGSKLEYEGTPIKAEPSKDFPNKSLDPFFEEHAWSTMCGVQKSKVLRTRPIFHKWSLDATVMYNPDVIDKNTLLKCIEDSGLFAGIGTARMLQYGRFEVEEVK